MEEAAPTNVGKTEHSLPTGTDHGRLLTLVPALAEDAAVGTVRPCWKRSDEAQGMQARFPKDTTFGSHG